jgi:hypothetical protein
VTPQISYRERELKIKSTNLSESCHTSASIFIPCDSTPTGVTTVFGTYGKCCNAFSTRIVDNLSTKKMKSCRLVSLDRRIVNMPYKRTLSDNVKRAPATKPRAVAFWEEPRGLNLLACFLAKKCRTWSVGTDVGWPSFAACSWIALVAVGGYACK